MESTFVRLCPSLPPELWIRILHFNTDLTHLWTVCRNVSTSFRAYTEQIFAGYVIHETYVDFYLEKYNLGGRSKRPEVPTVFSHFQLGVKLEGGGREKAFACFHDQRRKSEIAGGRRREYTKIMERWESNVRDWKAQMPNYTIRIFHMVNDSELPGLDIDIEARQIRFDWRKMYTKFFREMRLLQNMKSNEEHRPNGERLCAEDCPPPIAATEIEMRKHIRRKRLKEHYTGNEKMMWAIDSLRHFESFGAPGDSEKKTAMKLDPNLPGAGLGEKFFGSLNLVQELYLDEWSCMHRIDTKYEHMKGEKPFARFSVPPPDLLRQSMTPQPSELGLA